MSSYPSHNFQYSYFPTTNSSPPTSFTHPSAPVTSPPPVGSYPQSINYHTFSDAASILQDSERAQYTDHRWDTRGQGLMASGTPNGDNRVVKLNFSPVRIRSWINRIPLFTRITLFVIVLLEVVCFFRPSLRDSLSLKPSEMSFFKLHRLNTFPFVNAGFVSTVSSLIALIPLLDRFESDHGTLVTVAMFMGPFATLPGGIYILIDYYIFHDLDSTMLGSSVWVFLLLACEAVKQGRAHPSINVAGYQMPTWATTLLVIIVLNFLFTSTPLLGHLCGALIGYGFELGPLKFLVPPEKISKFIEGKLNLLGRLPHYVSVDQKTYGRYGVLPSREPADGPGRSFMTGGNQRLGP